MVSPRVLPQVPRVAYTIPQRLNQIRFIRPSTDLVEIAGAKFTPLEKRLMEETRAYTQKYGVETARIIDRNGKNLELILDERPMGVSAEVYDDISSCTNLELISKIIKEHINYDLFNCTHIHSHARKVPLSGVDILTMLAINARKLIATTPNGGFSSLETPIFPPFLKPWKNPKTAAREISELQVCKLKELGIFEGDAIFNASDEKITEYSAFSTGLLQDFADRFGFQFHNNI